MSKEWEPEGIPDLLGDDHARRILVAAFPEPKTASELADACDASLPTVYRRVNALADHGLVTEDHHVDPEGDQFKTFRTRADSLTVDVTGEGIDVEIDPRPDLVDRFEQFWTGLGSGEGEDE